jgi:putative transposase
MTRQAKKGKRKKQKAGLNKFILDVGLWMLMSAIEYKVKDAGTGLVVETRDLNELGLGSSCKWEQEIQIQNLFYKCRFCNAFISCRTSTTICNASLSKRPCSVA